MKEGFLMILKFFFFLLILPIIVAVVLSAQTQVLGMPVQKEEFFLWGVVIFVSAYFFLYNFKEVYEFGQSLVVNLFKPIGSLSTTVGLVLPLYAIVVVCLYLILNIFGVSALSQGWLFFALGFCVSMHLVLTAHQLYEADKTPIKGEYFFSFGWVLIFELCLIIGLLGFLLPEVSFAQFFKSLSQQTSAYYQSIYKALFISL